MGAESNLLQMECPFHILRNTIGPVDNIKSARSRYSRLLRFSAMCGKTGGEHARNQVHRKMERASRVISRTPQRELMENKFNSDSTDFLVAKRTRLCSESMTGFDKVKEKMGTLLSREPALIELFSWK